MVECFVFLRPLGLRLTAAPAERPVDAVIDAGRVGQLMVIGRHATASRHLGRLGSTARGVLHRAAVPVAVLPPSKTEVGS